MRNDYVHILMEEDRENIRQMEAAGTQVVKAFIKEVQKQNTPLFIGALTININYASGGGAMVNIAKEIKND